MGRRGVKGSLPVDGKGCDKKVRWVDEEGGKCGGVVVEVIEGEEWEVYAVEEQEGERRKGGESSVDCWKEN